MRGGGDAESFEFDIDIQMRDTDMLLDGPGVSSATTLESDESNSLIISRMKALEVANRHQHQKDMPLP